MKRLGFNEFCDALRAHGLVRGDIVHVQSDLRRMGAVECDLRREAILEFYLRAFEEVIGSEGTLSVFTGTMSLGRSGEPFEREQTRSEAGVLSEYVRTRPSSVRSSHPIMSCAADGPRAEYVCGGAHYEGVGYDSPWGRLYRANAWLMTLGIALDQAGGTTFFHHIEHSYGVPYQYTKLLAIPVFAAGLEISEPFTLSVRYLDFEIQNNTQEFKARLLARGRARVAAAGTSFIFCGRARDIFDEGISALREDRYSFLRKPPAFRAGIIPFDGLTGQRQQALPPTA
jgi:aminoglycoside 3-N-acetyltransferase